MIASLQLHWLPHSWRPNRGGCSGFSGLGVILQPVKGSGILANLLHFWWGIHTNQLENNSFLHGYPRWPIRWDQILKLGLDIPAIFMMECFEFHWQDGNAQFYGQISQQIPRLLPAKLWRITTMIRRLTLENRRALTMNDVVISARIPCFLFFTSGLYTNFWETPT